MTPREIDSRLNVLESRVPAEEQSAIFVKLISSLTIPTDGWDHDGFTYFPRRWSGFIFRVANQTTDLNRRDCDSLLLP